ncbi:hypothetical protein D3C76_1592950 [compost metagenome]
MTIREQFINSLVKLIEILPVVHEQRVFIFTQIFRRCRLAQCRMVFATHQQQSVGIEHILGQRTGTEGIAVDDQVSLELR